MKLVRVVEIRKDSVIVAYGLQTFNINNYGDSNRWLIKQFIAEVQGFKQMELSKLLEMTHKHSVKIVSAKNE